MSPGNRRRGRPAPLVDSQRLFHEAESLIWEGRLSRRPRWQRPCIQTARVVWVVIRDLAGGQLSLRAMSLVYTTMLSLVPLLAISFAVLKGFNIHQDLERAVVQFLAPFGPRGEEVSSRIIEFVNNIQAGVLGSLGTALLVYTVISLMQKIEASFNYIWHVPQERPFAQRFSGYLSVIMVGPVLVFASLGISASLMNADLVRTIAAVEPFGAAIRLAGAVAPYLLVVGAFALVYVFMPNTNVRVSSAVAGALVGGLLWNFAGWVFASFVVASTSYTAVYSAFASIIVFMLWLYFGWLILLIGSSVAFYHQHPEYLGRTWAEFRPSPRMEESIALALAALVVQAYRRCAAPPTTDVLAERTGIPPVVAARSLDAMSRAGLVTAVAGDPPAWVPAHPPERMPLIKLLDAIRDNGDTLGADARGARMPAQAAALARVLEGSLEEALGNRTFADLDAGGETGAAPGP